MLKEKYEKEVVPKMMEIFKYKNKMQVPKIEKVVVNAGIGKILSEYETSKRKEILSAIEKDLAMITSQKPCFRKCRMTISGFGVKKGAIVGLKVTLRRKRMWDFLERLIFIALPRTRDFKGIPQSSFDQNGNLTIGIKEHIVFPEIKPEKVKRIFGMEISIVTNAKTKKEAQKLFELLGFPLKK